MLKQNKSNYQIIKSENSVHKNGYKYHTFFLPDQQIREKFLYLFPSFRKVQLTIRNFKQRYNFDFNTHTENTLIFEHYH